MTTLTKKAQRFQVKMTNIILSDVYYAVDKMDGKKGDIVWEEFNKKGMSRFDLNVDSHVEYAAVLAVFNERYIRKGEGLYECSSVIGEKFIMEVSKFVNGKANVQLLAM